MGTSFQNYDLKCIGNAGLDDAQLAFRIDAVGLNTPLVYESLSNDGVFENHETWTFVIQDFVGANGRPATPFRSLGIASLSTGGFDGSTGSIIAVPEPGTLALLVVGVINVLVYAWRRRTKAS